MLGVLSQGSLRLPFDGWGVGVIAAERQVFGSKEPRPDFWARVFQAAPCASGYHPAHAGSLARSGVSVLCVVCPAARVSRRRPARRLPRSLAAASALG